MLFSLTPFPTCDSSKDEDTTPYEPINHRESHKNKHVLERSK